MKFTS